MNRCVSIGLAIAVAPAILLAIGQYIDSEAVILVSSAFLFQVAVPLGGLLVLIGVATKPVQSPRTRRLAGHVQLQLHRARNVLYRGMVFVREWVRGYPKAFVIHPGTWLLVSFVLGILVLILPFESDTQGSPVGFEKLFTGWFFVITGQSMVWLSAPLLVLAWICLASQFVRTAFWSATLALLSALPFIAGPTLQYGWAGDHVTKLKQQPEVGYYILLAAILAALISGILLSRSARPRE